MSQTLEVWGDYACFTNPAFKVERVSYDVMTPSAARGILEAIFWHPGMRYIIDKIYVCAPIRFTNIRTNELQKTVSKNDLYNYIKKDEEPYIVSGSKDAILQRSSTILRDVHYVIEAHFDMTKNAAPSDNPGKFQNEITGRIEKGRYYHQPFFGVRDFPVSFQRCEKIPECPPELKGEKDLGWMLLDLDYSNPLDIKPIFFRAIMKDGIITVPSMSSKEVHS